MDPTMEKILQQTKDMDASQLIAIVVSTFGDKVALASSFGAEDQVITHMLCEISERPQIFMLDTGRLCEETYEVIEATRYKYGIDIEMLTPSSSELGKMLKSYGPNLFYNSIEGRKKCCRIRKVEPLKHKLEQLLAWICGLRSEQAVTRKDLQRIEWDDAHGLIKISPLADWTTGQVWDYIHKHNVPYNKLHDKGYPSIGCSPCTQPVKSGQDIRSGRWWWEQPEHKECGLHLKPQDTDKEKNNGSS